MDKIVPDEGKRKPSTMPNPRDLMKDRHPDLFSDTEVEESPRLARVTFEYHLDTLTSRKQETLFEHFCRKLAEKEICPNLRPQTGPTGGGDSKVDTETYPVASEISERWWVGEQGAGQERWAFAFSAKKKWKTKAKADVENILSVGRDYKRIYFITNQFARDKERAELEDGLSKIASVPVHILDRSWIVEKVYGNDHLELAIAALGIEDAGNQRKARPGPRDTARLAELEELDKLVTDQARYQGARFQLVEDCLRSAILARGLERPRNEVDGRFEAAERLAKEVGIAQQQMRVAYSRAWTAHWWFEDFQAFNRHYAEVEQYLQGSVDADDVGRLATLWQLLPPGVRGGRLSEAAAEIGPRSERLKAMLQTIALDPSRLNNALQARTSLAFIKLTECFMASGMPGDDNVWADLSTILDESAPLGMYPVETLVDMLREVGNSVESAAFDALYEKSVEVMRHRRSDGEAGQGYVERGSQKLKHGKPYDAIRWFGRAEDLLVKEEYRSELALALAGASCAYEEVGLLWAARNKLLFAIDRGFHVFAQTGEMIPPVLSLVQRLAFLELQIGRIPHALEAMALSTFAFHQLKRPDLRRKKHAEKIELQEGILGIHFLNASLNILPHASRMPDPLERMGLVNARLALLFALGQTECIGAEGYFPTDKSKEDIQRLFELWQDQPAARDIAPQPLFIEGPTVSLRSTILGTEFVLETPTDPTSFGVAESLLGALESFLATSAEMDLLAHRERTTISLAQSEEVAALPRFEWSETNSARATITLPAVLCFPTAEDSLKFIDWLRDTVVNLLAHQFVIPDVAAWMERVAGDERAFSRALMLGDILTVGRNVFGNSARVRLADWYESSDKSYELLRSQPWRSPNEGAAKEATRGEPKFGKGAPPPDVLDTSNLKHTQRRVRSPIDIPLWDRAGWQGVLFACSDRASPALGIIYRDIEAGERIFDSWREQFGPEDGEDVLRIAIIRGISKQNPAHYGVIVGPNYSLSDLRDSNAKTVVFVSRIHRMEPTSPENLDRFLEAYQKWGKYYLAPAQMEPKPALVSGAILKRHLHVRQAWEIGENDPESVALHEDDDPVVPDGIADPPVKQTLERIRARRRKDHR
jgi:hypothetical protein